MLGVVARGAGNPGKKKKKKKKKTQFGLQLFLMVTSSNPLLSRIASCVYDLCGKLIFIMVFPAASK